MCQPSGGCAPLEDEAELGTIEIGARDWAVTTAHDPGRRSSDTDILLLGGTTEAAVHLAFDLRGDATRLRPRVRRAILRLVPTTGWAGPRAPARVIVHRSAPFEGANLTHRNAPRPTGSVIATREVDGPPRPLTLDVTAAVIDAERLDDPNVYLVIRQVGSSTNPVRFASPRAEDRGRRPTLSLFVR